MNKTLGSTLIVAGTTIGGGMLAMPLTSAGMGFGATVVLLITLWVLLVYAGLLFAELYQTVQSDAGIGTLAEKYYGTFGRVLSTAVLLVFLYALVSAYVAGGGAIFAGIMPVIGSAKLTSQIAGLLFVVVFGAFILFGTSAVDKANRLIFFTKLAFFALVFVLLLPNVEMKNLLEVPLDNALIISAAPIFFTAFGFHGSIPSLNKYLDGNVKALRFAIIVGTIIPLVAYILWQFTTHGVLTQSAFTQILKADPTLNGLVTATIQSTGSTAIGWAVRTFSALALITSFLGVALGLFETLEDLFTRVGIKCNRLTLGVLTFTPPLAFALFYPTGFILALGYAGQMFAFYAIVLPVAMVWKLRKQNANLAYQAPGGYAALLVSLVIGVGIVCIPFVIQAGHLPAVVG